MVVAAGLGPSAPTNTLPSATSVNDRLKRVVVAAGTDNDDTNSGLVFKRQRVAVAEEPAHSTSDGHAQSFRDNPPNASSPRDLIVLDGGWESVAEDRQGPSPSELPIVLQQALKRFQDNEMLESLGGNFLQDCVAQGLGDFLVASSLALSKAQEAQDLQARMTKLEEELALKTKAFSTRETTMYLELASLHRSEKDIKRLLFDKSQEAVQLEAKILSLRNKVVDLEEKVKGMQSKMVRLEERATQREVQLGQGEGELAEKVELFKKARKSSPTTLPMLTTRDFKMPSLSLPACILRWIFLPSRSRSVSLMGSSCSENDFLL